MLKLLVANMCGGEKCLLVEQIYKACENVRCSKPIVTHCIVHFQVLCGENSWIHGVLLNHSCQQWTSFAIVDLTVLSPWIFVRSIEYLDFSCYHSDRMALQWQSLVVTFLRLEQDWNFPEQKIALNHYYRAMNGSGR